ncbi:MAG TPA: prolyl oligopeptidase family serine peptidase [Caulobacteraceae bacterium]|jgi:prolyl oligopeptidase
MSIRRLLLAAAVSVLATAASAAPLPKPPVAAVEPVTDTYFGVSVTDPYRWMEDRTAPRFLDWAKGENDYARATLAQIPGRDALAKRIAAATAVGASLTDVHYAGGRVFYEKREPGQDTFKLYVRDRLGGAERLLVDPDKAATAGHHYSIDYYQPSLDGRSIAYGTSPGGSEASVIHILNVDSGQEAAETIDRTEYGAPSWRADGRSFFYNRFQKLGADAKETDKYLNSAAYLHIVGTDPETDVQLIGPKVKNVPDAPVDSPVIVTAAGSPWAVAVVQHGDLPALSLYVARADKATGPDAPWRKVADVEDEISSFAISGSRLFLLSFHGASRFKVIETDAAAPDLAHAEVIVAPGQRVLQHLDVTSDGLYVASLDGGLGRLTRYDLKTGRLADVPLPAEGTITEPVTDSAKPDVLFGLQSWLVPPQWYVSDGVAAVQSANLAAPWKVDTSAYVAEEVMATAPDGTRIPLSIIHKKGLKLGGTNPTWLTGYGAYGISLLPNYAGLYLPLLDDGGVLAVAHVRGGGEFGEEWHQGGRLLNKPNTYKDFIACAEYLVQHGYTAPSDLLIQGGSAGGITVGMALTARPDLFRVVISNVGDSNALRAEYETDGDANAVEYGSVKDKDGFTALASVDALSHVKDGVAYPAVLLTTGINDPRVAPWQPGKMTARLQAATSSGRPVILRVDYDAGHGIGSTKSQRDELVADELAFFYWQIGKPGYQPQP